MIPVSPISIEWFDWTENINNFCSLNGIFISQSVPQDKG